MTWKENVPLEMHKLIHLVINRNLSFKTLLLKCIISADIFYSLLHIKLIILTMFQTWQSKYLNWSSYPDICCTWIIFLLIYVICFFPFFFSLYYLRWFKAKVCSESHRILELHWPLQILWFMSSVSVVQGVALSSLNPTQSVYNFSVRMYVCLPLLSFLTQQQQQKFVRKQINSTTSFCK